MNGCHQKETLLGLDIDGTLTGDRKALDQLSCHLEKIREKTTLFLVTGRCFSSALKGIHREGVPEGDALICGQGTQIFLPPYGMETSPISQWQDRFEESFNQEEAKRILLDAAAHINRTVEMYIDPRKVSVDLEGCDRKESFVNHAATLLAEHPSKYKMIWAKNRHLDIIPDRADKGDALEYLIQYLELEPTQIIVAGDSANDVSMFLKPFRGIVVSNADPELTEVTTQLDSERVFHASAPFAKGVEEGLRNFKII
jgi:sucrose-6F-phosphate phosphohydrolase